jgi:chromosome segregation ATPase
MSLSRSELSSLDRQELVDLLLDLSRRLEDLEARKEAASRWRDSRENRLADVEDDLADLQATVADLRGRVDPDPESTAYREKSREQKVHEVRVANARKAAGRANNRAQMTYRDVMALFGEQPSAGHAYQLLELAAEGDGYEYRDGDDRCNRLTVNLEGLNDDAVLHTVNNAQDGTGGEN